VVVPPSDSERGLLRVYVPVQTRAYDPGKTGTRGSHRRALEGEAQRSARLYLGDYTANMTRAGSASGAGARLAAMFIQTGPNEFIVTGSGDAQIIFSTDKPGLPIVGIESTDEEFLRTEPGCREGG